MTSATTIDDFFKYEGINCLNQVEDTEAYFSNEECDCCGTWLAGYRVEACGYHPESKEVFYYNVCPECLYVAAYGEDN